MKEFKSFYKTIDNRKYNTWCKYTKILDTYGCGCQHDCSYCYARDIANRFYPEGFQPSYHPDRLEAPANTNVPTAPRFYNDTGYKNVFTCSMADLFGKWVPVEWIQSVIDTASANPQWNRSSHAG